MREINITRGMVAIVDDADAAHVSQFRWQATPGRHTFYARRSFWVPAEGRVRGQSMHTLLTGWSRVDHIDGDGLNNQRSNLRPASAQENRRNSQKTVGCTSTYKGVKRQGRYWIACIGVSPGIQHYLGCFSSEIEAARTYDAAAREVFGEFARLNFEPQGAAR
jgi:hypothetical protein